MESPKKGNYKKDKYGKHENPTRNILESKHLKNVDSEKGTLGNSI